jgi:hypothetical protein
MALAWLEQPTNVSWMRLEADDFGSLDDVAVLMSDGTLSLNQIKHVTERPERPGLCLHDLLEKKGKRSRSLFQKWFQSWLSVEADPAYGRVEVIVHANRPPAEDLAAVFCKEVPLKIDPALLRSASPTEFASFVEQAGNDAHIRGADAARHTGRASAVHPHSSTRRGEDYDRLRWRHGGLGVRWRPCSQPLHQRQAKAREHNH